MSAREKKSVAEIFGTKKNVVPGLDYLPVSRDWLGIEGIRWTPTSLTLPKGFSDFDLYKAIAKKIEGAHRFCQWALADLLHQGEGIFGERYAQISAELNLHRQYLMDLKSVASRVAPELRREALSFSHHRVIASLAPKDQKKILDLAEKNKWNREELTQRKIVFCLPAEDQEKVLDLAMHNGWTHEYLTEAVERYQQKKLKAPKAEAPNDQDNEVYHNPTTDFNPVAEFDVHYVIRQVIELLDHQGFKEASALDVGQIVGAIRDHYRAIKVGGETQ
jgi:hypothetical protein